MTGVLPFATKFPLIRSSTYIELTGTVPVRFWPKTVMLPLPPVPVTVEAVDVEDIEVEVEVVCDVVVDEDDDVVELDAVVEADVELLEDVDDDVVIGKVDVEE